MSEYTIITTSDFVEDFAESLIYYRSSHATKAVRQLRADIVKGFDLLTSYPEIAPRWRSVPGVRGIFRSYPVKDHVITYEVLHDQRVVLIVALVPTAFGDDRILERLSR